MEHADRRTKMEATSKEYLESCLKPTRFIDSNAPAVIAFAKQAVGDAASDIDRAVSLFYAVREEIRYDPYDVDLTPGGFKASAVLARGVGFCIPKAIVLTALARVVSIPSRLGFADVRNHLTTERLKSIMKTDIFTYHGFTELFLDGRWIKATPTFNLSLCKRFGVKPLDFDGRHDALFHEFDRNGNRHMEYVKYHGSFIDLPYDTIRNAFKTTYPGIYDGLFDAVGSHIAGDFEKEAEEDLKRA